MLDALSPQRRRLVLGTLLGAAVLVLALVAVVAVRAIGGGGDSVPPGRPGPVLLVPGYGGRLASLAPLEALLRDQGREVVLVSPPGDGTGDLDDQAQHLADVVDSTLEDSGAPSVDVVGYSAGGVVARLWVREHGGAVQARRVVTIGSPHHGSSQAALGAQLAGSCPTACEQLVPDSDLLRRLNAGDQTPDGPAWITLRSQSDEVVTPASSAALEGALNLAVQDFCPGLAVRHSELPRDSVVAATLLSTLGRAAPTTPGVAC